MGGKILDYEAKDILNQGIEKGGNFMVYSMVQDNDITPEKGAKRLGINIDELFSRMLSCGYKLPK